MGTDSRPLFDPSAHTATVQRFVETLAAQRIVKHVPTVDILRRTLLHLPRFSPGDLTPATVFAETLRIGRRAEVMVVPFRADIPASGTVLLEDLEFAEVESIAADTINQCFHYIGSVRSGTTLGLFRATRASLRELPLTAVTLSAFDLDNVSERLPVLNSESTVVVSRVYSFPWAPRNSLSTILRRVRGWLKGHRQNVQWLLTYVNPNVGFRAASYRADNWAVVGEEEFEMQFDESGDYLTPRVLAQQDVAIVEDGIGASHWRLSPLVILVRSVSGRHWSHHPTMFKPWSRRAALQ